MDEPEVSELTRRWLKNQGYKIKPEPSISGLEREVILDYFGYRETNKEPEILWIECKGDVEMSKLLEGFIRTELAIHYGGGTGIISCPNNATKRLLNHRDFIKQAEGVIAILNIEKEELHQL